MSDLQQFKDTYITECCELLVDMEDRLLHINVEDPSSEDVNAIFRCAHSIKGGAGAFGFTNITNFTHVLENLLDLVRDNQISLNQDIIDVLLESVDILKNMVGAAQNNTKLDDGYGDNILAKLSKFTQEDNNNAAVENNIDNSSEEDEDAEIGIYDINFAPYENLFFTGNEPLLILRELSQLGKIDITVNIEKLPEFKDLDPEKSYISWNITLETESKKDDINEVFEFVEDECDFSIEKIAAISKSPSKKVQAKEEKNTEKETINSEPTNAPDNAMPPMPAQTAAVTSIRVDIDKVDKLVNMVGELVITQSMIALQSASLSDKENFDLVNGIQNLAQHTIELQESVMAIRMQPVKTVFSRMPRLVRDLAKKLGKDIKLEAHGENTELDKTVIEQLADPLMHMIRNSVDHGIDTPDSRIKSGKPGQGVIKLIAEHQGGKIIIRIEDDGKGINREKVLNLAKEKKLIAQDAVLTDSEIDDLIFMPGFSTADEISDISGRGVGMDVVRKNIEGLGGSVKVSSFPDEGTKFKVTLPLTLAILDGMIVKVGREQYIIPIGSIIETLKPSKDQINTIADANEAINIRGEFISVIHLSRLFNIDDAIKEAQDALIVIVEDGVDKFGLVVDELLGQQQVVIKSLEENTGAVKGISAATILGDGKVSLILDINALQELSKSINMNFSTMLEA